MPTLPTVFFLISGSVLAVLHFISLELFLYWRYPWLDIPMHLLGGAVIVLLFFTIHDLYPKYPRRLLLPIPVLLLTVLVALLWEVFQIQIEVPLKEDYEIDTITDLIMGMLGAIIGYVVAYSVSTIDLEHEAYDPVRDQSFMQE